MRLHCFRQGTEEALAVQVDAKDESPPIATSGDVVAGASEFDTDGASHARNSCRLALVPSAFKGSPPPPHIDAASYPKYQVSRVDPHKCQDSRVDPHNKPQHHDF